MAHIFCIANQKGGVGKTTTAVNLAAALGKLDLRCLLVDLDPQGNATMGSGINKQSLDGSISEVLLGERSVEQVRLPTEFNYDILPANRDLSGAEVTLVGSPRRELRLREALQHCREAYDFILIDCLPSLSVLTVNALCVAHGVIVPMQCEYFALEGLSDLVNSVRVVRSNLNPDLQLIGLLRVMFDPRVTLQQQVSEDLKTHFGDKVFDTIVPRNVRLAEAPGYGKPGVIFDPSSRGAQAYTQFAEEFVHVCKTEINTMSNVLKKTRGLGKGLEVLLGPDLSNRATSEQAANEGQPTVLPLAHLQAGRYQPRTRMDEGSLYQLAESIRSQGIMQPILVRPIVTKDVVESKAAAADEKIDALLPPIQRYEIIAGERRFRAAALAGLSEVPVLVRAVPDEKAAVMALIENIQRENLNPIEEAQGLQRLVHDFGLTHEAAAQAVGRSRSAASNLLRLLQLADAVQTMLMAGDIDMGHARSLLALSKAEQITTAQQIASKQMSVREAENLVKKLTAAKSHADESDGQTRKKAITESSDRDWARLEEELSDALTTVVQIQLKKGAGNGSNARGAVTLPFANLDELQAIVEKLKRSK